MRKDDQCLRQAVRQFRSLCNKFEACSTSVTAHHMTTFFKSSQPQDSSIHGEAGGSYIEINHAFKQNADIQRGSAKQKPHMHSQTKARTHRLLLRSAVTDPKTRLQLGFLQALLSSAIYPRADQSTGHACSTCSTVHSTCKIT